jgi:hypothetical protein
MIESFYHREKTLLLFCGNWYHGPRMGELKTDRF